MAHVVQRTVARLRNPRRQFMKRTVTGLFAATIVSFVATLGAQEQQQPPGGAAARSGESRDITLTGCLAKDASGKFMLNNAMAGASTSPSSASPPSQSATASSAQSAANATWQLSGSASDLEKNIGKKIQVSGTPAAASASAAPRPDATTPPAPGAVGTAGSGAARTLDVKTVTMVAATCS
jgi:hypothetical protein